MAGTIKTWGEGWEIPYGEDDASIHTSDMFSDWESRATTSSLKKMPEPVCVERAFPPHEVAPKLRLDETVELLTRVLGASEDIDLSALSAALKSKLGLCDMKKPPTMSPGTWRFSPGCFSCSGYSLSGFGSFC